MNRIKYLFKRIMAMDYKRMFSVAKDVSKKSHKMYVYILCDIIICGIKYGAGYLDYQLFEMYNLNAKQRKTYLTRGKNNAFIQKYNSKEHFDDFDNKVKFNTIFSKYLKRDFLSIKDVEKQVVIDWINEKKIFVAKDILGTCGKGVKRIDVSELKNVDAVYEYLIDNNFMMIEEIVYQHNDLNNLHPHSINTIRLVTILKNNKAHIVGAFLRIGNGAFVDNINSGGMAAPINDSTGIIEFPAQDKDGKVYSAHPLTGVSIVGFKIPMWDECIELVNEAVQLVPSVRYVGWDISVTENGPVFIEGNPFPGHDIYQLPAHTPNKIGVLPKFEAVENEKE